MQNMQGDSNNNLPTINLDQLRAALLAPKMPTQARIADAAGISQATVSRIISGNIGESKSAKILWQYVTERGLHKFDYADSDKSATRQKKFQKKQDNDLKKKALSGLRNYLDDEYDPALIIQQIDVLRLAQRSKSSGKRQPRLQS